ncbi:GNAT family N-acetyltransferase [Virgisporangium aurantiacum]|uniref:Glycosyl transferase family 1 n=1 Tax=Virgisporangium aurantiacum TaxID=175570 RepID=A0A8J3Z1Y0_9ACTN|nr:GNAT family N-acetyltransferase [Virgisporangium aurantiacum]GIJ55936.1 glycosyl transferase family 1 [Virgisporangium aurantiacum]
MTTILAPQWTVEIRHDLTGLRPEWTDLFRRCAEATPFQSYAWNHAWWAAYGENGRLRVVLVRRGGTLVAAAAFTLVRRGGCAVLVPVGGAFSDFTDVLADDTCRADAVRELAGALRAMRGWQAVDFPEVRPGGVATRLAAGWRSSVVLPASLCLELPAQDFEAFVRDLPAHARKTVRRRVNQLAKLGLDIRAVEPADAERSTVDLLRLHRDQWQGRGGNAEHLRPAFAQHLAAAVPTMIADGQAVLLEYRLDGAHVASNLVVVGTDLAGGYLYGADPSLRDKLDVTTLLISTTLPVAVDHGCATMSMLRGAEPYKQRWRPTESVNRRVLLVRAGSPRGHAYAAAVRARAAAVRFAKSRAPWLRTVRASSFRILDSVRCYSPFRSPRSASDASGVDR